MGGKKDSSEGANPNTDTINFKGNLTVHRITEFHSQILEKIKKTDSLVLNLTKAKEIDISFLQLLCSACKYSEKNRIKLTIKAGKNLTESAWDSGFRRSKSCFKDKGRMCHWQAP